MRAARLHHSPRLQALLEILTERGLGGATGHELQRQTGSLALHTDIAELRANGYDIRRTFEGRTANRRQINRYTLYPTSLQVA